MGIPPIKRDPRYSKHMHVQGVAYYFAIVEKYGLRLISIKKNPYKNAFRVLAHSAALHRDAMLYSSPGKLNGNSLSHLPHLSMGGNIWKTQRAPSGCGLEFRLLCITLFVNCCVT